MKIIVTGGLGFIGAAFTRFATSKGAQVVVIDKQSRFYFNHKLQ